MPSAWTRPTKPWVILPLAALLFLAPRASAACLLESEDAVIVDPAANVVFEIDAATGEECVISAGGLFVLPVAVAVDSAGDVLVVDADAFGGGGGVIRVDPITGAQTPLSQGEYFVDPHAIALKRGALYVADPNAVDGNGAVIKVNPVTGRQKLVSSGGAFTQPIGIALAAKGRLLVTDRESLAVIEVEPSGRQKIVSAGGSLVNPIGIAVGADGELFIADSDAFDDFHGGVVGIDAKTGAQRTVASGGAFNSPTSIAIGAGGHLMVVDQAALVVVEPTSGEQTPIAWGAQCVLPWSIAMVH